MKKQVTLFLAFILVGCSKPYQMIQKIDYYPPFINLKQSDFYTDVGKPLDFSNVTGYDDFDGLLPTSIEGKVDYSHAGNYPLKVICKDLSGNQSSYDIIVHVQEKVESVISTEQPTLEKVSCDSRNAKDSSKACDWVDPKVLEDFEIVYSNDVPKELCIETGKSLEQDCEIILQNNQKTWGYGIKNRES